MPVRRGPNWRLICASYLLINDLSRIADIRLRAHQTGYIRLTQFKDLGLAEPILKAEEKKGGKPFTGACSDAYVASPPEDAEKALMAALAAVRVSAGAALRGEDFTAAMASLATLRAPIDDFFDTVKVNADDADLRRNRLLLLADIRGSICSVADFGRIEG